MAEKEVWVARSGPWSEAFSSMQNVQLRSTGVKPFTAAAEESQEILPDDPQHVVDPAIRAQVVAHQGQFLDDTIRLPACAAPVTAHIQVITGQHCCQMQPGAWLVKITNCKSHF